MNIRQTHYHPEVIQPLLNEKRFNDGQRDRAFLALFKFGTLAVEPNFSDDDALDLWWEMAKGTIERLNSRRWNGINGGRPPENEEEDDRDGKHNNPIENNQAETESKPSDNQSQTKTKPPVPEPVPVTDINNLAAAAPSAEILIATWEDEYALPVVAPKIATPPSSDKTLLEERNSKSGAISGRAIDSQPTVNQSPSGRSVASPVNASNENNPPPPLKKNQANSMMDIISSRIGVALKPPKTGGATHEWQDFAVRFSDGLGIKLETKNKPSWFRIFRDGEKNGKRKELEMAYGYLLDSQTWANYDNNRRLKCIYYIYNYGLESFKAKGQS